MPTPGPGEVLVQVMGAGVNRGEILALPALRGDNPKVRAAPSGIELAGVIAEMGRGVTGWSVGERVMARGQAGHTDYALCETALLMRSPERLSDVEG